MRYLAGVWLVRESLMEEMHHQTIDPAAVTLVTTDVYERPPSHTPFEKTEGSGRLKAKKNHQLSSLATLLELAYSSILP